MTRFHLYSSFNKSSAEYLPQLIHYFNNIILNYHKKIDLNCASNLNFGHKK
jgi:hypothetical protein